MKGSAAKLRRAILLLPSFLIAFTSPTQKTIRDAIGDLGGLTPLLQRAFTPNGYAFEPIPQPGPNDWLAVHPEPGQTFDQFKASRPNQPTKDRHVIYLQPIGQFLDERSPSLDKLREFAAAFFAMEVKALPPVAIENSKFTTRINPLTGNRQILTSDVLAFLQARIPADAFCVFAITMQDLYPEPSWNFVFGKASLRERVRVYSFARYDPAFMASRARPAMRRCCCAEAAKCSRTKPVTCSGSPIAFSSVA